MRVESGYLACSGISKRYGTTPVLRGVGLSLERGQCLALLGPSGCGKTTLLNIIQGIVSPDAGRVVCDGVVLDDPSDQRHVAMRRRGFATVFQDFSLWPHMSIAANVAYGLRVLGVGRSERQRRVSEALDLVGMGGFERRHPASLSGGQQQRVAIARAVVVKPRVLLLDEPLSALDVKLREELRDDIAALLRELEITSVYVTHDQSEAFVIADHVAVMNQGKIEQTDRPEAIYQRPASAFVAGFLGSANVLPYHTHADHLRIGTDGASEFVPQSGETKGVPAQGVCRVLRERVYLSTEPPDHQSAHEWVSWPGRCEQSRFLGDRYELSIVTDGGLSLRAMSDGPMHESARLFVRIHHKDLQWLAS